MTTYSYRREWVDKPVDLSRFKESGHENRGRKRYPDGSSQAAMVTLGGFRLPPGLVSQMDWSEPYALAGLPEEFVGPGQVVDGVFHTGRPGDPEIGDERVSFSITRPRDVSVLAVQRGDTFAAYKTESGKTKFLLYPGLLTAEQVVKGEQQKAMLLRWVLRGGGVFAMFFGFLLVFKPLSVLADVIPFLGSLAGMAGAAVSLVLSVGISFMVIALSWIAFRPLVGIPLLLVGAGCLVMVGVKLARGRRRVGMTAPPPPPPPPPTMA